jgi:hypothetical protein
VPKSPPTPGGDSLVAGNGGDLIDTDLDQALPVRQL